MEVIIKITYRWWNDEKDTIKPEHQSQLEAEAEERIQQQKREDYTGGELNCEIEDIHYNGWWDISTSKK